MAFHGKHTNPNPVADDLTDLIGEEHWVRVEVSPGRAYTYRTYDPVQPGELVLCPSNTVQGAPFEGLVLRLVDGPDPSYPGPYKTVRRARKRLHAHLSECAVARWSDDPGVHCTCNDFYPDR